MIGLIYFRISGKDNLKLLKTGLLGAKKTSYLLSLITMNSMAVYFLQDLKIKD